MKTVKHFLHFSVQYNSPLTEVEAIRRCLGQVQEYLEGKALVRTTFDSCRNLLFVEMDVVAVDDAPASLRRGSVEWGDWLRNKILRQIPEKVCLIASGY